MKNQFRIASFILPILLLGHVIISCKHNSNTQLDKGSDLHNVGKIKLEGVWIPESINWKSGDFYTFYFFKKENFIIINSTQKLINDSIYFQAEPGFVLREGKIINFDSNHADVKTRVVYREFNIPNEHVPSSFDKSKIDLYLNDKKYFYYLGIKYIQTSGYTASSIESIHGIAYTMLPTLTKTIQY